RPPRPTGARLRRPRSPLLPLCAACSGHRRSPLREPMWRDTDLDAMRAPCRIDENGKEVCRPETYESSLTWDGADNIVFRPLTRLFAVDPGREAVHVIRF